MFHILCAAGGLRFGEAQDLSNASKKGTCQESLATYTHPQVLVIDEVGYLSPWRVCRWRSDPPLIRRREPQRVRRELDLFYDESAMHRYIRHVVDCFKSHLKRSTKHAEVSRNVSDRRESRKDTICQRDIPGQESERINTFAGDI
jgi:ribosomal protein L15E